MPTGLLSDKNAQKLAKCEPWNFVTDVDGPPTLEAYIQWAYDTHEVPKSLVSRLMTMYKTFASHIHNNDSKDVVATKKEMQSFYEDGSAHFQVTPRGYTPFLLWFVGSVR